MDGEALLSDVRAEADTELSRLGAEKVLLAATRATLEPDAIAGALASDLAEGSERLDAWAEEADDAALARAMADAAERYEDLRAATLEAWSDADTAVEGLVADLGDPAGDAERAGAGLVGLPLALDGLLLGAVSYHVNEADEAAADRARDLRSAVAELGEEFAGLLAARAGDDDAVREGAVGAIEASYRIYASRLEAMGLDPKPIC